ncbi:MAG TPA: hypothetical protein VF103_01205 [Polyangiaceae bacterium]
MGRVNRTRNLGRLGVLFFLGAGLAIGCAGKSESSNGNSEDDGAGTSGNASGGTAGSLDGGTGGVNGGTGAVSKGGCGPTGGSSGKGGGCAVAGTSGTGAGTAGIAGSETGGVAGVGGTPGTGGSEVTGGAAGEAGTAGTSGAECRADEDCVMVSDCCSCRAEPRSGSGFCPLDCLRDPCSDDGIEPNEVSCVRGRCVIARSCDRTRVTCRSAPPDCVDGTIPSVDGTCWGPCIAPTECSYVTDCLDCPSDAACVEFQAQLSSFSCVLPASGCSAGSYCSCLGACDYCSEAPQGITCACPVCSAEGG